MDYLPAKKVVEKWNVNSRTIQRMCRERRINVAIFVAHTWLIPNDTEKSVDMRYKINKQIKDDVDGCKTVKKIIAPKKGGK